MRIGSLTGTALAFMAGQALADTPAYVSGPLLPPILGLTQPSLTAGSAATPASGGSVVGYDLGYGFKTEVEGVTARTRSQPFGNLPAGGDIAGSSVMLNGLYEFSDGAWRLKPYVGAGFGLVDANARMIGATQNDWVSAYQLHGGVSLGFTQKLMGNVEYRWTMGSKPRFLLAGIPTKLEIDRHGFVVGVNYKY
jgi:opacity protein-like surface antigen